MHSINILIVSHSNLSFLIRSKEKTERKSGKRSSLTTVLKDKKLKAQRRNTQRTFERDQEEEEIYDGDKKPKAQRRNNRRTFERDQEEEESYDGDYSVQSRRSHYGNQGGSMVRREGRGYHSKMRPSYRDHNENHSMPSQDSESDDEYDQEESGYNDSHHRHCQV
jgi:hypothetical protein